MTPLSVRRAVDRAIAERRLDAPDRYVHLQVARLSKALRAADMRIEEGDLKAVAPFVRVVAELDRYHGLGVKYQRRLDARALAALAADPRPPLALAHAPWGRARRRPRKYQNPTFKPLKSLDCVAELARLSGSFQTW